MSIAQAQAQTHSCLHFESNRIELDVNLQFFPTGRVVHSANVLFYRRM